MVEKHPKNVNLGKLIYGLGLPKFEVGAWMALGRKSKDSELNARFDAAFDSVLEEMIRVLNIDVNQLVKEALCAKKIIQDTGKDLIELIPDISYELNWDKTKNMDTPVKNLVNALCHPSRAIAYNATRLLYAGMGGEEAASQVRVILNNGRGHSLQMVSTIALKMWQNEALYYIVERLEKSITEGCEWLFKVLQELPGFRCDERIAKVILKGLSFEDPKIAAAAGSCLEKLDCKCLLVMKDSLMKILNWWNTEGSLCKECGIKTTGSSCPQCHVVPESPRPALINALAYIGALDLECLLGYYDDDRSDVIKAVTEKLSELIHKDRDKRIWVINKLNANTISSYALDAVLMLRDDELIPVKSELIKLIQCPSALTRFRLIKAMSSAKWLRVEEARSIIEYALDDEDPNVRDKAVSILRTLLS